MDTPVVVAMIGGWSTIIVGLLEVRRRVNGPITEQFQDLKADVLDLKGDVRDLRADLRSHLTGDGR